jgi:hypothetical protein
VNVGPDTDPYLVGMIAGVKDVPRSRVLVTSSAQGENVLRFVGRYLVLLRNSLFLYGFRSVVLSSSQL